MDTPRAFGFVLKQLRADAKISQEELAGRSGYTKQSIYLLEGGKRQPKLQTIIDLSRALNITATEFIRRVERRLSR